MSDRLSTWYSKGKMEIPRDKFGCRQSSIEAFLNDGEYTEYIDDMIALFFDEEVEDGFEVKFSDIFKTEDPTFSEDKVNEMKILAGDILYEISQSNSGKDSLRVQVLCMMRHFYDNDGYIAEVSDEIRKCFFIQMVQSREKAYDIPKMVNVPKVNAQFLTKDENGDPVPADYDDDVRKGLDDATKALNNVISNYRKLYDYAQSTVAMLHEDTQLLWWLMGGIDDKSRKRYSEMSLSEAIYLCGYNLAQKVNALPGPVAADAMINHMLKDVAADGKIAFKEFVKNVDDSLIEEWSEYSPVLDALENKRNNGENGWQKAVKDRYGMDIDREYSKEELAYEIYLECIYQKMKDGDNK